MTARAFSDAYPRLVSSAPQVRYAAWVGLVCNLLLSVAKLAAGIVGHSQAVIADAIHSFSDIVTDVVLILGVRYWSAPADERHPHGHRRFETLITLAIGVTLGVVAIAIGYDALHGLQEQETGDPGVVALIAAVASIAIKEWLYRWTLARGRAADSSALIANAWHHRSDALSSIPVTVAVGAAMLNPSWAFVDHVGALVVCVFILHAAHSIIRPAVAQLADTGAPEDDQRLLERLALNVNGVRAAHALRTRYVGPNLAVDLHLEVDGDLSVIQGYEIALTVRHELLAKGPKVADVVIQLEPFRAEALTLWPSGEAPREPQ